MKESILIKAPLGLLAALLLMSCPINAKSHTDEDSIRQYYVLINKAELTIVDSNFNEAINLYDSAFQFKRPNPLDLHNALCATAQIQDCKNGRRYLEKLAHLGYRIRKSLLNNNTFWNCTAAGLAEISDKVTSDYLLSAVSLKLDSLIKADQDVRDAEKTDYEQMAKVDGEVRQSLYNLLKTEEFIKVEPGMTYGNAGNEYSTLWLVRWHERGRPSILDSIILANVLLGNYDPAVYASLTSVDDNSKYGIYYNPLRKWSDKERKIINQNRSKIYLEPLEDYEKKIVMQLKTETLIRNEQLQYGDEALWNTIYFILTSSIYQAPVQ